MCDQDSARPMSFECVLPRICLPATRTPEATGETYSDLPELPLILSHLLADIACALNSFVVREQHLRALLHLSPHEVILGMGDSRNVVPRLEHGKMWVFIEFDSLRLPVDVLHVPRDVRKTLDCLRAAWDWASE